MGDVLYFGKDLKFNQAKNSKLSADLKENVKGLSGGAIEKVYKAIKEEAKGKVVDKKTIERALGSLKGKRDYLSEQKLGEVSKHFTGHSYVLSKKDNSTKEEMNNMPVRFGRETNSGNIRERNNNVQKANPTPPPIRLAA